MAMRPQGSPADLERRRLRALALLERDIAVHVVAERLGVDRRSVRRWKRAYRQQGPAGVAARPVPGRPPKLTARQCHTLVRWILKGPEAAGSRTALWTCRRIAALVQDRFGVRYHPDHIGRLLRACGLSPQRPQRTAQERDDRRVRQWLQQERPRVKERSWAAGPPVLDENRIWSRRAVRSVTSRRFGTASPQEN